MTEHTTETSSAVDDLARVEGEPTDVDLLALVEDDQADTPAAQIEDALRDTVPAVGERRADLMPNDFALPALVRFVPNAALREVLERAVEAVVAIDVTAPGGLVAADQALGTVRDAMKAIEAHFDEPKRLAHEEHKRITGKLAEWLQIGEQAVADVGRRLIAENERLTALARENAQREQEALDREASAAARQEATFAAAAGAPAEVVADLERAAEHARATTVATVAEPVGLARNTVAKSWKARLVGTRAGDEINPDSDELTPTQIVAFENLLRAVLDGRASRACVSINWKYNNKRASSDKSAMLIPGLEAVQVAGLKAKGGRA